MAAILHTRKRVFLPKRFAMKQNTPKKTIYIFVLSFITAPLFSFFHVGVGVGDPYCYRRSYVAPVVYSGWGWGPQPCDNGSAAASGLLGFAAGATLATAAQRAADPEEEAYLAEKRRILQEARRQELKDLREERKQEREQKRLEREQEREERERKRKQKRLERKEKESANKSTAE